MPEMFLTAQGQPIWNVRAELLRRGIITGPKFEQRADFFAEVSRLAPDIVRGEYTPPPDPEPGPATKADLDAMQRQLDAYASAAGIEIDRDGRP